MKLISTQFCHRMDLRIHKRDFRRHRRYAEKKTSTFHDVAICIYTIKNCIHNPDSVCYYRKKVAEKIFSASVGLLGYTQQPTAKQILLFLHSYFNVSKSVTKDLNRLMIIESTMSPAKSTSLFIINFQYKIFTSVTIFEHFCTTYYNKCIAKYYRESVPSLQIKHKLSPQKSIMKNQHEHIKTVLDNGNNLIRLHTCVENNMGCAICSLSFYCKSTCL